MQRRKKQISKHTDFFRNLILYYVAVVVILFGYLFLSIGGADSFTSITLGPIVLVIGYLVAVPVALLTGAWKRSDDMPELGDRKSQ